MNEPLEILLVEDNEGDVEMVERALQDVTPPCHLSVAKDGMEGMDRLFRRGDFAGTNAPQLVLLDLNMPRLNGKELLKQVKQDEKLKAVPVIVLTSSEAASDIQQSYAAHANAYVVKPFDVGEFMDRIRDIVHFWRDTVLLPHEAIKR
jgi:CheY-like chemotaxis protein